MGIRSLVLLSVVVTPLTLTLEAYADPTGSGSTTSSSTASGTGGATSTASSTTSTASSSTASTASSSTTAAASSSTTAAASSGTTSAASSGTTSAASSGTTAAASSGTTAAASGGTTAAASSGTTAASGGTTTTGGGGSATTGGGGGSATSPYDPNCTKAAEAVAGTTCTECDPTGTDTAIGPCNNLTSPPYTLVCQRSKTASVYCDGPVRTMPSDQNIAGCTVSQAEGSWSGFAAVGALALAAALLTRRRRS